MLFFRFFFFYYFIVGPKLAKRIGQSRTKHFKLAKAGLAKVEIGQSRALAKVGIGQSRSRPVR